MTLAEKLTRYGVNTAVSKGHVDLEAVPDDLDALCDADGNVTDTLFTLFLDELDSYEAYLDEHPEGSDRGGYVVWVENPATEEKCFYYEPSCEWNDG